MESLAARAADQHVADSEDARDAGLGAAADLTCLLGMGPPVPEIARLANQVGAALLVMGSHGHTGLANVVHGTTTEGVRHRVRANVLTVKLDDGPRQDEALRSLAIKGGCERTPYRSPRTTGASNCSTGA